MVWYILFNLVQTFFPLNICFKKKNDPPSKIGLKSKSGNETYLSYDINLLHTLKLMPEAVLNFCSLLHCMFCSLRHPPHVLQMLTFTNVCI